MPVMAEASLVVCRQPKPQAKATLLLPTTPTTDTVFHSDHCWGGRICPTPIATRDATVVPVCAVVLTITMGTHATEPGRCTRLQTRVRQSVRTRARQPT